MKKIATIHAIANSCKTTDLFVKDTILFKIESDFAKMHLGNHYFSKGDVVFFSNTKIEYEDFLNIQVREKDVFVDDVSDIVFHHTENSSYRVDFLLPEVRISQFPKISFEENIPRNIQEIECYKSQAPYILNPVGSSTKIYPMYSLYMTVEDSPGSEYINN